MRSSSPPDDSNTPPHSEDEALQVLLVEDNPGDARLFQEYVDESATEARIRHEETLQAGLRILREERPDVLVIDLGLPDSAGTETVETATAAAPEVPIVVLTGEGNLQVALQAQQAGAAEYLRKEELTPALAARTLQWVLRQSQMQEKLRQRDAWIRSITESISAGVFRTGPTGRIEYANQALAEMLGFESEEELVGRDLTEFYADLTGQGRMLAEEGAEGAEVRLEGQGGEELIGLLSARPAYDQGGKAVHYDGTIIDITGRKEDEQELAETKARYESLVEDVFDGSPVGVFILDQSFQVVWANAAIEAFFGLNRDQVIGANKRQLIEEKIKDCLEDPGAFAETVEATYEDNTYVERFECHVLPGQKSEERWLDHQSQPIEQGRFKGGRVELYTDITARKQKEQDLRVLSEAVEQAKESVLITEAEPLDKPGPRIEYVNAACEEMTGYSEEELIGKTPRILQGPETDRGVLDSLREALEAGEEWQGETVNYRKDGTPYTVQWNIASVRGEDGEVEHWVSVQRDVTEQRRREEELRHQKGLLEQTQRLAGAWEIDLKAEELSWSEKIYEIHEVEPGTDIEIEEGIEFYAPEARPTIRTAFERCVEEGESYDLELPIITAKGNRRWVRTVGAPGEERDGEITKVAGAFQDITERTESRRRLERYRAYTDRLLDGIDDLFFVLGEEGQIGRWNGRVPEVTGYSGEEIGKMEAFEFVPEEEQERVSEEITEAFMTGSGRIEVPLLRRDGRTVPYEFVGNLVEHPEGGRRVVGIGRDITERKRRERELETLTTRLQLALESTDTGVFDWDLATGEVIWDETSERLFGFEPGGFSGYDSWAARLHPDDLGPTEEEIEDAIANERTFDAEYRVTPPEEEQRWIRARGTVEYDEDGAATRMIGIHMDITDQKRRERELIEAKEEAERMNRLKSAFLANMSHEIRTPLTSILGFAEMIGETVERARETGKVDLSTLTEYSSLIERSGQRLMETLTGVLNLSKLQAGEMDFDLGPVDLAVEAEEAAEEFGPQAEDAGIGLLVERGTAPVWARADDGGLGIVLRNLLSNAIKYTDEVCQTLLTN